MCLIIRNLCVGTIAWLISGAVIGGEFDAANFGIENGAVRSLVEGDSAREVELARARLNLEHAKAALYEARKTLALLMEEQEPETSEQGFLGIFLIPASKEGVRVARILPDAAAAKAGVNAGDLVVAINGKRLADAMGREAVLHATYDALADVRPGDEVQISVLRDGLPMEAILIAEARHGDIYCDGDDGCRPFRHEPLVPYTSSVALRGDIEPNLDLLLPGIDAHPGQATAVLPFMEHYGRLAGGLPKHLVKGLELAELNAGLGRYFGAPRGVLVVNVRPDGIPGLQQGDVILSCGDRVVTSPRQMMHMLMGFEQGDVVDLTVMRDHKMVDINLQLTTMAGVRQ